MKSFLLAITRSIWGIVGTALTTASACIFLTLFAISALGYHGGPYQGILSFVIVPGFFVLGLLLIPVGVWTHRRKMRRAAAAGVVVADFPVLDLNQGSTRKVVLLVLALTAVNLVILAAATYKSVEVMDSTEFCGSACHEVMAPELTTYRRSPHARVKCVSCHIGPGADWFVKSKLSGSWQLVSVAFDLYPRPIPTPVHNLRPAQETCEQCHWPSKFVGDRLKVYTHFSNDEENSTLKNVVLLRVGGVQGRVANGIHWHVDPANRIRYRSDETREIIHEVELSLPDGTVKTFHAPGREAAELEEAGEWRVMDCVDCHNRPTHIYRTPESEMDEAMRQGNLPTSLPYLRREGLRLLRGDYASHDEARQQITAGLASFYEDAYPEIATGRGDEIQAAGQLLGDLYSFNVFPDMNITWGTYPNHIGHEDFPGCFRCHDEEHATEDGEVISQDCSTCHTLLAWEEEDPEILEQLNP
jgi:hypothetical protein